MTAIKRESIVAAVTSALAGTTGVSTRIYRSRAEAFARDEAPAIIIEPAADVPRGEPVSTCKIDWTLTIAIIVYTRGAIPDQLAAPIVGSLHAKLMADRTLGGLALDVWPGQVLHQKEQADQTAGWTTCNYTIRYRSSITDLTA
jgi:hypothetical protein